MNLSELSMITDPIAKKYIVQLLQRVDELERRQQLTPAVGYQVKISDLQPQTAFVNYKPG